MKTLTPGTRAAFAVGLTLQFLGPLLPAGSDGALMGVLATATVAAGLAVTMIGCAMHALSLGHSGAWGALGLLSVVGMLAVLLLPGRGEQDEPEHAADDPLFLQLETTAVRRP
ncbi:MAG TPA: hypothetical protein VKA14_02235 [Gammaproteobacteria bacterium]|nr:hypothetical protein [Gammaproteobacteria bacterium]